ncbi:16S rRNA (cytosine(967)-C(5))-methyltransferase RsmB [Catenovulum sp. 2E275]|uniref:16S rRNA (cytosine(967)-C(5))-methyltransferase RsmB n=1 Tax=Catenovulum sp. 2E275 TaxID=2980497 RepID=UPI0021D1DC47|nr:16S rRNA (cytosine(967)-C(5))-methyltransferase RsmB [Catenovulum sp. 2E275]MCU4675875.1 16S rRNA (cytosine(967)-C(5))-methyltransferase RsmB [Catenovulum sp. 2E275]
MSLNTRAISAQIIYAVLDKQQSLGQCFEQYSHSLTPSQRGQCQDFVYGVLRHYSQYNYFINQLTHTKIKPDFNLVRYLIAVGIYQLEQERVADHAAVGETVEACKQLEMEGFSSLVNALLRSYQREQHSLQQKLAAAPAQVSSSHPDWLIRRLKAAYPKGWKKIVKQNLAKPPFWLRINQNKQSAADYKKMLSAADIAFSEDKQAETILLAQPTPVDLLPEFFEGACSVQDKAAQQAARLLGAQNGEYILDACAAPGGKTAHILEIAQTANCDALDIEETRLNRVSQAMQRLNLSCNILLGDASKQDWWSGQLYDRILLDAPCSATGVIRRHPDILYLRKDEDINALSQLQSQILKNMWSMLKPGGTLLYATCSVLPEENKQQIIQFLKSQPDAKLDPIFDSETSDDPGWQILPGNQNMDGFYYARLIKQPK